MFDQNMKYKNGEYESQKNISHGHKIILSVNFITKNPLSHQGIAA